MRQVLWLLPVCSNQCVSKLVYYVLVSLIDWRSIIPRYSGGGSTRDGLPGGGNDDLDSALQRRDWSDGRPGRSDSGGGGKW
jgi:hypothetical protein